MASIQATMKAFKDKIEFRVAEELEDRLEHVARYAVAVSPVDTGAYVESFSIGVAGFGGGRSRKSEVRTVGVKKKKKGGGANAETFREKSLQQLYADIQGMDIEGMLKSGNVKFTLRNRAPHSVDVENGENWDKDGYHVFTKIRNRFG